MLVDRKENGNARRNYRERAIKSFFCNGEVSLSSAMTNQTLAEVVLF